MLDLVDLLGVGLIMASIDSIVVWDGTVASVAVLVAGTLDLAAASAVDSVERTTAHQLGATTLPTTIMST